MEEEREEEMGFDEYRRKKRGSGKAPSSTNPRGAGRPTKEWEEYREFLEWQRLRGEGISPRSLRGIFEEWAGPADGRSDRGGKTDRPRIVGKLLETLGWKKKDIEKIKVDKLDKALVDTTSYLAPYIIPKLMIPIGILAGVGIWYGVETITLTHEFTEEEWNKLSPDQQGRFIEWEIKNGTVHAKYRPIPPILHTAKEIIEDLYSFFGQYAADEYNITGLGVFRWMTDKPIRFLGGPFSAMYFYIQKLRGKI